MGEIKITENLNAGKCDRGFMGRGKAAWRDRLRGKNKFEGYTGQSDNHTFFGKFNVKWAFVF